MVIVEIQPDFNDLCLVLIQANKLPNKSVWNGNLYLTMNTDFEPIIHGWIQYEETSLKINLRFIYNHKIQTWVKSD